MVEKLLKLGRRLFWTQWADHIKESWEHKIDAYTFKITRNNMELWNSFQSMKTKKIRHKNQDKIIYHAKCMKA